MKKFGTKIFYGSTLACLMMVLGITVSAQTYSENVIADNPLVYWRLNNDLTDAQGNVNLNPAASPQFVEGIGSGTKAYSSSDGKAWAASFGVENLIGAEDFSYELWINLKGDNEGKYILQRYAGGTAGGENSLAYENGQIYFIGRSGELSEPAVITLANQTDAWHHLVLSYNYQSATIVFYLDGVEAYRSDQAFLEPIFGEQDFEMYIGATRTDPEERVFNGYLDEIAIYAQTLSAEQVVAHFNASTSTNYATTVKADSPVIYWRFEDNFDDEFGGNDLLPSGVQFVEGPGGSPNKALFGRITSTSAEKMYDNVESYTYELWFNPLFKSSNSYILFRNPGGAQNAVIFAYKADGMEFFYLDGGTRPLVTIPNETNKWYYCVVINDLSVPEMRIYIDGVLVSQTPGQATQGTGNLVVLGGSDQGDNFNGYIDEVAFYDYALSDEKIQAHYNSPMNPTQVGEWSIY